MRSLNLCLHSGGHTATLEQVTAVETPAGTESWKPIAHRALYDRVVGALTNLHMTVVGEQHALAKNGLRYFALLQVANGQSAGEEYAYVIGLRNGHDKSIVAGLAVGGGVFVCDNLSFLGEIVIARKHTTHIERDLPVLTGRAIGQLSARWTDMDNRFKAYKEHKMCDDRAHDMLVRSLDQGAITCTMIPHVLQEWRKPKHEEFAAEPKTAWRFFNAVTEASKGTSVFELPRRTQALHALVDSECGIVARRPEETIAAGAADTVVAVNN